MSFNDYIYWQTVYETGKTPEEIYEYEHPEVVRCKDCKHGEYREDFNDYECHSSGCGLVYDAEFYCADGERKESE